MKYQNNELFEYFDSIIADVPDFPKAGIIFKDITPVLENKEAFKKAIDAYIDIAKEFEFDKVLAADARGFIFGAPIAYSLNKGLVVARKPGKLPRPGKSCSYDLEYGSNTLLISEGAINPGEKVLVIDDLLATGGSAYAMCDLVTQSGGKPVACVFLVELCLLNGAEHIEQKTGVKSYSLVKYIDVM